MDYNCKYFFSIQHLFYLIFKEDNSGIFLIIKLTFNFTFSFRLIHFQNRLSQLKIKLLAQ